jgi:hypothetical protein
MTTLELLTLAESWARAAGSTLAFWPRDGRHSVKLACFGSHQDLMACALDLRHALSSEPDYLQAAHDLHLERVQNGGRVPT